MGKLRASAVFLLAVVPGCASFEREWEAAGKSLGSEDALQGRWQGTWKSDVSGHTGSLRCIITKEAGGHYRANYHATYGWALSFRYAVSMSVEMEGSASRFQGTADLGWLAGGEYHYEGTSTANQFTSTYRSKSDHGKFEMVRADAPKS